MYVGVKHRITDPDRFFSGTAEEVAQNAPPGVTGRQFLPSKDRTAAICLWEGDSVDAVRDYVDSVTGDASENEYFEISEEYAFGLPEAAAAGA